MAGDSGRFRSRARTPSLLLACLLAAAALVAPAAAEWRVCDEGAFTVTGGEVQPTVGHAGEELAFVINGTLDRDVSAGILELWVDYLGFHVYSKSGDLCAAVGCPLAKGKHTLELRQKLPAVAPPGPYLGVFQASAEGGPLLFCVNIPFRIALRREEAGPKLPEAGQGQQQQGSVGAAVEEGTLEARPSGRTVPLS